MCFNNLPLNTYTLITKVHKAHLAQTLSCDSVAVIHDERNVLN